ncbi:MAG: M28 family peptidase [Pseudomonadaceae bacterium]|nr:M28 family peptidase [Pseudomonadaceae bacterium]
MLDGDKSATWPWLLLATAIVIAALFKGYPLQPPALRADDPAAAFDAQRAFDRLADILGDEAPHPIDSPANDLVRERLLAQIDSLGFEAEVRDDTSCLSLNRDAHLACGRVRNVLFVAAPDGMPIDNAVMLAAHYDSVPAAAGANDDGVGVAVLLEIAALVDVEQLTRPLVFLFTDGEEVGLLGAASFVRRDPLADAISDVLNVEARGARGPAVMFETASPNAHDVQAYAAYTTRPLASSMMTSVYRTLPNDTDLSEFLRRGYNGLNFAIADRIDVYHSKRDDLASIHMPSLQDIGDKVWASLRGKLALEQVAQENLLFNDILGLTLVVFPAWLGWLGLGLGIIAALWQLSRTRIEISGPALGVALIAPPVLLVAAGGLAFCLQALLGLLRDEAFYWFAHPAPLQVVAYLCALLPMLALLSFWRSDEASYRAAYHSSWLWFGVSGLVAGLMIDGMAVVFVLPLAAYLLAAIAAQLVSRIAVMGHLLASLLLAVFFLELLFLVELMLTLQMIALVSFLAAVAFLPAVLACAQMFGRPSGLGACVLGLALLAAFVGSAFVPAYSEERPGLMSFRHVAEVREDGEIQSYWAVLTRDREPPARVRQATDLDRVPLRQYESEYGLPAPMLSYQEPTVELGSDAGNVEGSLHARFDAPGFQSLRLEFPQAQDLESVVVAGVAYPVQTEKAFTLACHGRACSGMPIEFRFAQPPKECRFEAFRPGLPEAPKSLIALKGKDYDPVQRGDGAVFRRDCTP